MFDTIICFIISGVISVGIGKCIKKIHARNINVENVKVVDVNKENYSVIFLFKGEIVKYEDMTLYYMCKNEINNVVELEIICDGFGDIIHVKRRVNSYTQTDSIV